MRIGIDISQVVYKGTGVSRYLEKLVAKLLEIDLQNEYILFGSSLRKRMVLEQFFNQIKTKNNKLTKRFLNLPLSVLEILWNRFHRIRIEKIIGRFDLLHTSDWIEPPSSLKKITTIHDLLVLKYPKLFPVGIVNTHKRRLSWVKKESRAILVDSQSTKADCISLLSIPENKLYVVYPGIDNQFSPVSQNKVDKVKEKYSIEGPYILTVGTREPRKNLKKAIEALKSLKNKDLSLVVVGKFGWGEDISKLKINPDVMLEEKLKIIGYVPDDDLPALYTGASCFLYPSLSEGFGFPVLEAMRCGCPVVSSDKGSLLEIGKNFSIFVDPLDTDSITRGLEKALRMKKKDSEELIGWAKTFSWEKTANETLKIYQLVSESL